MYSGRQVNPLYLDPLARIKAQYAQRPPQMGGAQSQRGSVMEGTAPQQGGGLGLGNVIGAGMLAKEAGLFGDGKQAFMDQVINPTLAGGVDPLANMTAAQEAMAQGFPASLVPVSPGGGEVFAGMGAPSAASDVASMASWGGPGDIMGGAPLVDVSGSATFGSGVAPAMEGASMLSTPAAALPEAWAGLGAGGLTTAGMEAAVLPEAFAGLNAGGLLAGGAGAGAAGAGAAGGATAVGAANAWNPVGWGILGTVALGSLLDWW